MKPIGAYGTGWVCGAPVGQTVSCTTSSSTFTNGTALPDINVVAIVTTASLSASVVQNASTARASSVDANPGTATSASAGTRPAAPSGVSISPAVGPLAGGGQVVVSGTSTATPTAIEIGTTAEQQGGTPVTLLPCPGAAAAGCFSISGSTFVISSMPARASAATVSITLVTLGVATAASYVYAGAPDVPAVPSAIAGITSVALTWVAPVSNGTRITGYVVTPYLGGVAQTPLTFDPAAVTRTITGLTAGGSYTFKVAALNAYGTSAASAASAAVVVSGAPTAPTIGAASVGDSSATLSWTAPSSNGGTTITGYVVTPYIGTVAQTPQTFTGTATTRTVTGLTPGTAYTFTVAARGTLGTNVLYRVNAGGALVAAIVPGLTLTKTANKVTTVPGATIGYTVTATNSGATVLSAATFSDSLTGVLDDAAYNADAAATSGTPSLVGSTPRWTGALAAGATATITYSVTVHAADGGDNLVTNTVTSTTSGTNCTVGNVDPRCVVTVPVARLIITQGYASPSTTPGSVLRLNASFTNTGKVAYTGITISSPSAGTTVDAIPTGDQTASSGTLVLSSSAITWTGNIPVGGVVTVTGTLSVKDPDPGDKIITGTLVSAAPGNNCPAGGRQSLHRADHRPRPRSLDRQDRERDLGDARCDARLHGHRHQHGPNALQRCPVHRFPDRRADQGELERRRHGQLGDPRLQLSHGDLDRRSGRGGQRHDHLRRHRQHDATGRPDARQRGQLDVCR